MEVSDRTVEAGSPVSTFAISAGTDAFIVVVWIELGFSVVFILVSVGRPALVVSEFLVASLSDTIEAETVLVAGSVREVCSVEVTIVGNSEATGSSFLLKFSPGAAVVTDSEALVDSLGWELVCSDEVACVTPCSADC